MNILNLAQAPYRILSTVVSKTPVVGHVHRWTEEKAQASRAVMFLLGGIIAVCTGMMIYVLPWVFKLILLGKLDAVA